MPSNRNRRERAPAFQFYPKDFLSDPKVVAMTFEQRGCLFTLLAFCWLEETLPSGLGDLARLLKVSVRKMTSIWDGVKDCFEAHPRLPGRLVHPRLERERRRQADFRAKQRRNGERGGRPRKPKPFLDETQTKPLGSAGFSQTEPKSSTPLPFPCPAPSFACELASADPIQSGEHTTRTRLFAIAKRAAEKGPAHAFDEMWRLIQEQGVACDQPTALKILHEVLERRRGVAAPPRGDTERPIPRDAWTEIIDRLDIPRYERLRWFAQSRLLSRDGQTLSVSHDPDSISYITRNYATKLDEVLGAVEHGLRVQWISSDIVQGDAPRLDAR